MMGVYGQLLDIQLCQGGHAFWAAPLYVHVQALKAPKEYSSSSSSRNTAVGTQQ
jgi:hypothetical protein